MKVGLAIQPLSSGHRVRGIGFYTRHLLSALKDQQNKNFTLLELDEDHFTGIDLVHYPFFDLFQSTLKVNPTVPTVVTVHDVIPLLFKKHYPPGIRGRLNLLRQKQQLLKAEAVITDSLASRKDIKRYLGIEPSRIEVIYLATAGFFRPLRKAKVTPALKKYHLPERYILYTGDVNYHKNLFALAEACHQLRIPLVVAGKQAAENNLDLSHPELRSWGEVLTKFGKSKYLIRPGFLPDDDLVSVYNGAALYCQPSFYEGFGLPVLEAMACGLPVVCSNRGSLPEVGGQAALYFNPEDPASMVKSIKRVLSDISVRDKLVNSGLKRAKDFSWSKTARETIKVYQTVDEKK